MAMESYQLGCEPALTLRMCMNMLSGTHQVSQGHSDTPTEGKETEFVKSCIP